MRHLSSRRAIKMNDVYFLSCVDFLFCWLFSSVSLSLSVFSSSSSSSSLSSLGVDDEPDTSFNQREERQKEEDEDGDDDRNRWTIWCFNVKEKEIRPIASPIYTHMFIYWSFDVKRAKTWLFGYHHPFIRASIHIVESIHTDRKVKYTEEHILHEDINVIIAL